jgi:hypothetical protein
LARSLPRRRARTWSFEKTAAQIATSSTLTILVLIKHYGIVHPKANDDRTVYKLTAKDVPVDGFW